MKLILGSSQIELHQGDITESDADGIVNAANSQLILGAGVAGAIRDKGGPGIQEECQRIGHCPAGGAVVAAGHQLKARFVIHAVGPRQGEGDEAAKLRDATRQSLERAEEHGMTSIAFPAISTGVFGFPVGDCARIMLQTVRDHLSGQTGIRRVSFVLFDSGTFQVFAETLQALGGRE
ncbi:MAG: macro domain-containing protein [Nitrospinaceae bacterium]